MTYHRPVLALPLVLAACVGPSGTTDTADPTDTAAGDNPLTCADVDRGQAGTPFVSTELIPADTDGTLSGVYRVSGRQIFDAGQTVTIEAGTVFLMEADSRLYFGWRNDPATVFAEGTADAPILFCGTTAGAGHWNDVQILGGTTSDSRLSHVRIEDAGGADAEQALWVTAPVDLSHVAVVGGGAIGATFEDLGDGTEQLTITGHAGLAVELIGENAINHFPEGTYTGNGDDAATVKGFDNTNVVFVDRGIPYRQDAGRIVFGAADGSQSSFTVEAGVEYQFCQDCFLYVGWRNDPGTIDVNGTEADPVVFTSASATPSAGDWDGIELLGGTTSDSSIDHAAFRYAGKGDGQALLVTKTASITNSSFADGLGWGIVVDPAEDGDVITLDNNTFSNLAKGDVDLRD